MRKKSVARTEDKARALDGARALVRDVLGIWGQPADDETVERVAAKVARTTPAFCPGRLR